MSASNSNQPLAGKPLNEDELMELDDHLADLLRFLGAPGDWGYNTRLGNLTQQLHQLRRDIENMEASH